jgi:hypothetical protein
VRATCPTHIVYLDLWRVQFMKLCSFLKLLNTYPSFSHVFSSVSCLQVPSVYILPLMSETKFHTHTKLQAKLKCPKVRGPV